MKLLQRDTKIWTEWVLRMSRGVRDGIWKKFRIILTVFYFFWWWCTWQGIWKKVRILLTIFFFQNGKTNYGQALILIEMLLFLETRIASCANVPVTRVSSCLWQLRFSGSSVFTLKTQIIVWSLHHAKHWV